MMRTKYLVVGIVLIFGVLFGFLGTILFDYIAKPALVVVGEASFATGDSSRKVEVITTPAGANLRAELLPRLESILPDDPVTVEENVPEPAITPTTTDASLATTTATTTQ